MYVCQCMKYCKKVICIFNNNNKQQSAIRKITSYTLIQQTGQNQKVVMLKDSNSYTVGILLEIYIKKSLTYLNKFLFPSSVCISYSNKTAGKKSFLHLRRSNTYEEI